MVSDLRSFLQYKSSDKKLNSIDEDAPITQAPGTFLRSKNTLVKKSDSKTLKREPKIETTEPVEEFPDDDDLLRQIDYQLKSQEHSETLEDRREEINSSSKIDPYISLEIAEKILDLNPSSDKEDAAISKVLGGNKKKVLRISDDEDDVRINTVFSTPEKSSKKAKRLNENITEIIEEQHIETTKPEELVVSEKKPFNYFQMMANRSSGPLHPGVLKIPDGLPNCLAGFSFVFTGNFNELGREEISDLAKKYGGKVVSAPSKRTSFVVVGENPGPGKIEKIKDYQLKCLTEEQFYKLIESQPAKTDEGHILAEQPLIPPARKYEPQKLTSISKLKEINDIVEAPQEKDTSGDLWTVKYSPKDITHIIGNQGNILKLRQWLQEWKRKRVPNERAVLISGPPGIGKTSTAQIISTLEGFKVLEYNASDTRSKKALHDTIQDMLSNRSMAEYHGGSFFKAVVYGKNGKQATVQPVLKSSEKAVVIMDEVDGMSAGDRGGIAELILLIKKSKLPIICICNDRASVKVRSLANYCLDLRFRRPDARSVFPRIKEICEKEGLSISPNVVEQLVASTHGDIRQILNILSSWRISRTTISFDEAKYLSEVSMKDTERGTFDITAEFLSRSSNGRYSINQLLEMYFMDASLVPLMIQENYIHCKPSNIPSTCKSKIEVDLAILENYSKAANSIAESDIIDKKIHGSNQEWSLAPMHGVFSCVIPCYYSAGALGGRIEFSSWLGQNSKTGKNTRILTELTMHMCLHTSGGKSEIRQAYLTPLINILTMPLLKYGVEGVDHVIAILDAYTILKEDYDQLLELGIGKIDGPNLLSKIPTNVKSALTRTYNKESHMIPYSIGGPSKKQSISNQVMNEEDPDIDVVDIGDEQDEKDDVDLTKDKMIKATRSGIVKKATKKSTSSVKKSVPSKKVSMGPGRKKRGSGNEDTYDEDDGFVVDDDEVPRKRRK